MVTSAELVKAFDDTCRRCESDSRLSGSIRRSRNTIVPESEDLGPIDRMRFERPATVTVSGRRSMEAASVHRGTRTCVLNFASYFNPGGGVREGSRAQEESLCRVSTLFFKLTEPEMAEGFYMPHRRKWTPLFTDDLIFTSGITVFKTDSLIPKEMPEQDWFDVDVITCASPDLRYDVDIDAGRLKALHEKRLRRILDVALLNGAETVILGAFGCGVFRNDPRVVASAFRSVTEDYLHAFKEIEFGVYDGPENTNFNAFEKEFKDLERFRARPPNPSARHP